MHIDPVRRQATFRRRLALTPLIDVIFLLLLFFMLSSTFQRSGMLRVSAGEAGGAATAAVPGLIVRAEGGGTLRINGETVDAGAAADILEQRREAGAKGAVVTAATAASVGDLTAVLDALAAAGIEDVRVVRRNGGERGL